MEPATPLAHPLTYVRYVNGWGKIKLAQLMRETAARLNVNMATNRSTVWKWEQGQEPDETAQMVLASLLKVPLETVAALGWPHWLPVWDVTGLTAPWTPAGTVDVLAYLVRSELMDRRGFLTITGTALTGVAASWADATPAMASALRGDRVTDGMVGALEQRVGALRLLDNEQGSARLLQAARSDLSLVTGLLAKGRYSESTGRRLHGIAAETAYLTGWLAFDTGLHSAAQHHYVGALRAARTAGNDGFGAHVLVGLGAQAADHGHHQEYVNMAETAMEGAPRNVDPATHSFLSAHYAEALSRNGQHRDATRALQRAFGFWGRRCGGDDPPSWLGWYGEAQLRSTEGKILLRSGHATRAADSLSASVDKAVPRDQAVRSGRLAIARLDSRDLDGALEAAHGGIALLEDQVTSARAVAGLHEFNARLSIFQPTASVRSFQERLRTLPAVA